MANFKTQYFLKEYLSNSEQQIENSIYNDFDTQDEANTKYESIDGEIYWKYIFDNTGVTQMIRSNFITKLNY